jgi:hypothetical protein
MKKYQLSIIKEYISTCLISEEPDVYLQAAILNLFDYLCGEDLEHELEALFEAEKKIPIRRLS